MPSLKGPEKGKVEVQDTLMLEKLARVFNDGPEKSHSSARTVPLKEGLNTNHDIGKLETS